MLVVVVVVVVMVLVVVSFNWAHWHGDYCTCSAFLDRTYQLLFHLNEYRCVKYEECSIYKVSVVIKLKIRSHYNIECSSFISVKYHYFSVIPGHINASVPPWHMFKKCHCGRNLAPALGVIHKRPFPLPHYSGIYYCPTAASVAQTNDLVWGMICQDYSATLDSSCWTQ